MLDSKFELGDSLTKLRNLGTQDLKEVSNDLRNKTITTVAKTGGHLGAGLGVVELTLALHYVFDTPMDKIIWDVGHQTYPHKILTDRIDRIETLRKEGGLSGFTKRSESEYDSFGAGHSSTSISAALGIAKARDLKGEDFESIAVIGDGSISAGMAYEAMNNAGAAHDTRLIVILNDNEMSIAPAVGAMSNYLSKLISSSPYTKIRNMAKKAVSHLPDQLEKAAKMAEKYTKDYLMGGNFFEEIGFYYVGPTDGHDIENLVEILSNIKEDKTIQRPILIHVKTQKGYGYEISESKDKSLHAVGKFDVESGKLKKSIPKNISYTEIFANQLIKEAKADSSIVAITAAMPSGTGIDKFEKHFPKRTFDVGIAEQHAVTFAAGLACEDIKPYCAIYSTFLQRAYDQIIHDVAIQKLPVRFIIDRAGLVGADGSTHAGSFDIMYLSNIPDIIIMAPSDEIELSRMIKTSVNINYNPSAIRFPRGESIGLEIPENIEEIEIGKGRIIKQGKNIAILSVGTRLQEVKKASDKLLSDNNIDITIADMRFVKPLDESLILEIINNHKHIITIEEGSSGGFGSKVNEFINSISLSNPPKIKNLTIHDKFIEHGDVQELYEQIGLNASGIIKTVNDIVE